MLTSELLDLSDLIYGWYKPSAKADATSEPDDSLDDGEEHDDERPDKISIETAVGAIDQVLAAYPGAIWKVSGDYGRIVAGARLVSLAFPVVDEMAEVYGWVDASSRLGDGTGWTGEVREEKRIDISHVNGPRAFPRFNAIERGREAVRA